MSLLEVSDLSVAFDTADGTVQAVRGLSFAVPEGQTLAIVGESGSGKSVSTQTVTGLTRGARVGGSATFDGHDLLQADASTLRACYVDPARWRTGVGRRLMEALIDRLNPGRWTHLVLWTVRDAAPTNAFYVSLGMVRDGREALLDRGGPVPLVRFSVVLERIQTNAPTTTVPEAQMGESGDDRYEPGSR